MKITIVGAGPAGLYFAILMKSADPAHQITIFERDGRNDTFGWGIVFSDRAFSYLRDADHPTYEEIASTCETWEDVDVVHRNQRISVHGNRFSGISRLAFLNILQRRAESIGVELRFNSNASDISALSDAELLVGADGANSRVRHHFETHFKPDISLANNKYVWLGTPQSFSGLTLTFRPSPWGPFAAHSYRFSQALSTFIVECGPDTWQRAEFDRLNDHDTCARLCDIFGRDLQHHPLLTNNFMRWQNFAYVTNRQWFHGRTVLIGDALHTVHFSIGSGTKLAVQDAIALAAAFKQQPHSVSAALAHFQERRKPEIDQYQAAANESLHWFERIGEDFDLPSIVFAYRLMTRSGRLDRETLRRRDPDFVSAYERAVGS